MYPRTDALIAQLSAIHPKGFDLSLDRISNLLEKLGNPHLSIPPAFHVAGTNGKGSTIAFIRAILEAGGYRVNVHTSPHLVHWGERYRLSGKLVDDNLLSDAIARATEANSGQPITVFEILSAVMFILFSEQDADFSVVEVGLGGRFDATNVIDHPLISVIAPVALDHQAYLGNTIGKIAFEKAGIIKPGLPVIVGEQTDEARTVIEQTAVEKCSPAMFCNQDFQGYREHGRFVYQDTDGLLDLPMPKLLGEHQISNAGLAIAAIRKAGINIDQNAISRAMITVEWPGRLERLQQGNIHRQLDGFTELWIDGGHNPSAGEAIARELSRQNLTGNLLMICGMINTKDPLGYFYPFKPLNAEVLSVPVSMSDAGIDPETLALVARQAGLRASAAINLSQSMDTAREMIRTGKADHILFCGSLYLIGEVLALNQTYPT